jgi:hypothetical protein
MPIFKLICHAYRISARHFGVESRPANFFYSVAERLIDRQYTRHGDTWESLEFSTYFASCVDIANFL